MCICVSELTPDTARMWGSGVGDVLHIIEMKSPLSRLGCIRVSNGCHRKFRGHNFDSCVTNFDKISVFLFAPAMANFVDFPATVRNSLPRCTSNVQNPTHRALTTQRGAQRGARRAARLGCGGLGPKMAR